MVGVARLELAASWSRTKHATKLRYTPNNEHGTLNQRSSASNAAEIGVNMATAIAVTGHNWLVRADKPIIGCPTRIRTQTNRVRVCRATITQSGSEQLVL